MNFPEPFQAVALELLSYLEVSTINYMMIFLPQIFLMALGSSFLNFSENYDKEIA